ncbi:hypothetical protein PMG11_09168 [Penicillium brasilianum]|uniref:FAD-binding domain-containing protein n=1 Tax=Penicillium brasilianum TaxID=104259 RepID=A0A0F7TVC1_PENBI|nr:hypothetical protein PMG11_09168 [Penicillium brasilianum]
MVGSPLRSDTESPVAVIGAGPVGLFTALVLAQSGINVTVFEAGEGINQSPRAVAYFPPVLEEFSKAGILDDIITAGEKNADGCDWRTADGAFIAGIDPPPNDSTFAVCLAQPELGEILMQKLLATSNANVFFNESFQRLEQSAGSVRFWTRRDDHETEHTCQYLIGADGGRSSVRHSLGIHLEGHTLEQLQFVAVNFQYPLREHEWKAANFIVDPVDWGIVVKRGKGNSWRLATGIQRDSQTKDPLDKATIDLVKRRLRRILPGDTSQIQYEAMAPYVVHQRCASRFRDGNVLLAGDAAHLNNPVGGLGLTTGLLDAAHLAKALKQVIWHDDDPKVLTTYSDVRRRIFLERTSPLSTGNLLRLFSQDPEHVKEREETFAKLKDPKDVITASQTGLPDFCLTTTSDKIFDTRGEVTWFVSVTRIPDWTEEKFRHEYEVVHANMTRIGAEKAPVIRRYVQLENLRKSVSGTKSPVWDYVTCLTWPTLFVIHVGLQDPDYRRTAGSHIFCRLDQEGCLMSQMDQYTAKSESSEAANVGPIQCLIYHKREGIDDDFTPQWFSERAAKLKSLLASDGRPRKYILWHDVTPKTKNYFHDSQFSGGSWLHYKALETLIFADENDAVAFFEVHNCDFFMTGAGTTETVIGVPDVVI